ncbi:MAG TPA: molybdenum cofactor guanylyltransferase [Gemmatimonadaceae bacterium]|nr:molybdenum cofactor guanylyltransferase [Gemmatimonadaceae bacterium]
MDEARRGFTGAIIAGGAASRFSGHPKGLERVGGRRVIDRVAGALAPHTGSLLIAANHPDAAQWISGAAIARDVLPVTASVTGIHAALAAAGGSIVAIAWDMPFVPDTLVAELTARLAPGTMAVVPRPSRGPEPLCAAYAAAATTELERLVRSGTTKLTDILGQLGRVAWIEDDALRRIGDPDVMFFNVNTAADLARANEIDRSL